MTTQMIVTLLVWCRATGMTKIWINLDSGKVSFYEKNSRPTDPKWILFDCEKVNDHKINL